VKYFNIILSILACGIIFVVPADGRTSRTRMKVFHGHSMKRAANCQVHVTASGELADCRGWRPRENATGWDNTCFRSLDYLPSMYACAPSNR
jgi:hypothetical protein